MKKHWRPKGFLFEIIIWLSELSPIYLNTYVMGLRPLEIFYSFSAGSKSDVYLRQIMTSKVDPGTVGVNIIST